MADVKTVDEEAEFPEKRKLDLSNSVSKNLEDEKGNDDSNKRQKIEIPAGENGSVSPPAGDNAAKSDEHLKINAAAAEEDEDDDDEDEEDYNAEQDEDGDEDENGEAENVDRKGKGIMRDDKGKGKMMEDSEDDDSDGHDDDDDDSSDDSDSDFSDGLDESDLDDDPLAEVDLDNILPSRTRQRQVHSGVRIFNDPDKGKQGCHYAVHFIKSEEHGSWLLAAFVWHALLQSLLHGSDCEGNSNRFSLVTYERLNDGPELRYDLGLCLTIMAVILGITLAPTACYTCFLSRTSNVIVYIHYSFGHVIIIPG